MGGHGGPALRRGCGEARPHHQLCIEDLRLDFDLFDNKPLETLGNETLETIGIKSPASRPGGTKSLGPCGGGTNGKFNGSTACSACAACSAPGSARTSTAAAW